MLQELLKGRVTSSDVALLYAVGNQIGGLPVEYALEYAGLRAGNIMGSKHGGWGFNVDWDITGSINTIYTGGTPILIYIPESHLNADRTLTLTESDLQSNPFFLPFIDPRLTTSAGSVLASDPAIRSQLLAEALPARTFAAGANRLVNNQEFEIGAASFNMHGQFQKRGWPAERLQSSREQDRWKHSDLHDIAYPYTGMVLDKFVELEGGQ